MIKNTHLWLGSYITQSIRRMFIQRPKKAIHIMFCIVDHFEPRWDKVGLEKEVERTDSWIREASAILKKHLDADKRHPKYTLFYPIDEFTPEVFKKISEFCESELGEIEVHLHHSNDTADSLRKKLEDAKTAFAQYGHLSRDQTGNQIQYGFVHGNWALDNSRKDGAWCGVNNELEILNNTGCYADFTLPSAPSDTQTSKVNSVYYAKDDPLKPKSHNTGKDVTVGIKQDGDLMIIQGPLALNWKRKKFYILPKIENGSITLNNPPAPDRIDLWVDQHICVKGRPEWIFVKVHTHGAQDQNLTDVFFRNLDFMFGYLEQKYNDGVNYNLHYVTAREMYNIIKAAEADVPGAPEQYKDFLLTLR